MNRIHSKVNFDSQEKTWQRPPPMSMILECIYGVLVSDKRHTVMYMHVMKKLDRDNQAMAKLKRLQEVPTSEGG